MRRNDALLRRDSTESKSTGCLSLNGIFPVTCPASLQYQSRAGQCRMRLLSDRLEAFPPF
jgi:hypothetical protein